MAEGVVSPSELDEALRVQRKQDHYASLGDILIAQKIITPDQLLSVLERYRRNSKLGDLLLKSREINSTQLQKALDEQRRSRRPLAEILLRLGYVSEERLRLVLCQRLHIRFFNLDTMVLDSSLRTLVSEKFAMKHRCVPISRVGDVVVLAMDDPTQMRLVDDLQASTGLKIEIITSTSAHITRALERLYHSAVTASPKAGASVDAIGESADDAIGAPSPTGRRDSPDEILRELLRVAVDRGASDIHLETIDTRLQLRFRVDGMLQLLDVGTLGDDLARQRAHVLSHIKTLATLDIAERRRPQDGRFRARVESDGGVVAMDVRVFLMPSYYGENAVIRLIDPRSAPDSVAALNMAAPITERLLQFIRCSSGMILVTGPAGSGKSTSLFAIMKSVYRPEIKIVTAEDPIEYVSPQFCQHEVDDRVGNTSASYLRSFLRQDPDVIMVSEIHDAATATLAFRAAQAGHLVLGSLHTNDALTAIARLKGVGVSGTVCSASLRGVLAQRLVREICSACKEEYTPPVDVLTTAFDVIPTQLRWYRGVGCERCHHTGYKGRMAIAELWTPDGDDIRLINQDAPHELLVAAARKNTYSMANDAFSKLSEGRTTLDELLRVLPPSALQELRTMVV